MNKRDIDLADITAQGRAVIKPAGGTLDFWTTQSITSVAFNLYGDSYKRHCAALPGEYRLPFRIDMNVKLDYPSFILLVGGGHVSFATPWQDNRKIEDILKPTGKPNQDHYFYNDNGLPFGEFTDISVIYNPDEMQILIGGEERYYTRRQAYMRLKKPSDYDPERLKIRLAVSKLSVISIKSISVTEFEERAPVTRGAFVEDSRNGASSGVGASGGANAPGGAGAPGGINSPGDASESGVAVMSGGTNAPGAPSKLSFEDSISRLPQGYQDEIRTMDGFLTSLRPMKFRRVIDKKGGKISYVASGYGFSYAVNVSGAASSHNFGWYIVTNGKPETWRRIADNMETALVETAKADPGLAERIFYALNDCVGCYGSRCLAKTLYAFDGQKRLSCHGRVVLRMRPGDFSDARGFINVINSLSAPAID